MLSLVIILHTICLKGFELVAELEQLVINLGQAVSGVNAKLTIGFSGSMLEKIVGLYSSTYKDEDGNDV